MSKAILLAVVLVATLFYLKESLLPVVAPPAPTQALTIPNDGKAGSLFSEEEIAKVRLSLLDTDSEVRWSAVQLLYFVHDPQFIALLEKMIREDPDPELRIKLVGLMKGHEEIVRLGGLINGLHDTEKSVRIAALNALGEIGDPSVTTWVVALLRDPEPDVRIAALKALGNFQEKRKVEYQALAEKLKKDYQTALERSSEHKHP